MEVVNAYVSTLLLYKKNKPSKLLLTHKLSPAVSWMELPSHDHNTPVPGRTQSWIENIPKETVPWRSRSYQNKFFKSINEGVFIKEYPTVRMTLNPFFLKWLLVFISYISLETCFLTVSIIKGATQIKEAIFWSPALCLSFSVWSFSAIVHLIWCKILFYMLFLCYWHWLWAVYQHIHVRHWFWLMVIK